MPALNFAAPFILAGQGGGARVRQKSVGGPDGYMSVRLVCGLLLFVSCEGGKEGGKDVRHIKLPSTFDHDHLEVRSVRTFPEDIIHCRRRR